MPSVRTSEVVLVVICGCLQTWKGCEGQLWDVVLEPNPDTTNPAEQKLSSVQLKLGGDASSLAQNSRNIFYGMTAIDNLWKLIRDNPVNVSQVSRTWRRRH